MQHTPLSRATHSAASRYVALRRAALPPSGARVRPPCAAAPKRATHRTTPPSTHDRHTPTHLRARVRRTGAAIAAAAIAAAVITSATYLAAAAVDAIAAAVIAVAASLAAATTAATTAAIAAAAIAAAAAAPSPPLARRMSR